MGRVVITGAGVVSPLGSNFPETMENIANGTKGIDNIRNFDTENFPVRLGAEAKNNGEVLQYDILTDRKAEFIKAAVGEILPGSQFESLDPQDRVIHLGAGIDYFDLVSYVNSRSYISKNWNRYCKRSNLVVRDIAESHNIKGGCSINVSACVASTQAVGLAYRMLKEQPQKMIITGGFDSMLCHLHYLGFYKLGALSNWEGAPGDGCKPFDKNRCGLVIGEGAAAYLLQDSDTANPADILAEIAGYSSSMDSYMVTDPHPEGTYLAKCALEAIKDAGITPQDIDCAHLHGTGTFRNCPAEAKAMKLIFGDRSSEMPVYSMKGQIGHLIGACGAMELLGVIDSIANQRVLPTVNFDTPDPEVPLNVVTGTPLKLDVRYVLKLNAAFGGQNTALVIKKYE